VWIGRKWSEGAHHRGHCEDMGDAGWKRTHGGCHGNQVAEGLTEKAGCHGDVEAARWLPWR